MHDAAARMLKLPVIPTIQSYMTPSPQTIGAEQSLAHAQELMRRYRVRHLPVLAEQDLVGVVSDADLDLDENLRHVDPNTLRVEEAMTHDVYVVAPDAPLDEVVEEMARFKYRTVVVVEGQRVVGLFTTLDACRAFADMLHTHLM